MRNVSIGQKEHRKLVLFFWIGTAVFLVSAFLIVYFVFLKNRLTYCPVDADKLTMSNVIQALDAYKVKFGHYPDQLEALVDQGVMPSFPLDKWGRPLHYELMSESSYWIASFGLDGKPGGTGDDEDFVIP